MFERYTERARHVIVHAQEEARSLRHAHLGTEHLLLGLLGEGEGLAARTLLAMGVTPGLVRERVTEIVGLGEQPSPAQQIPFTPRAKKVLEGSLREALSLGHNYIGTEHILLALVRESEGVGSKLLFEDFGLTDADIRNRVHADLGTRRAKPRNPATTPKPAPAAPVAMQGWECPRCRTIHSPYTASCSCAAPTTTSTGTRAA
jgi:ATP-dependent Clp protease ATP-binding subunit ClpC